MPYVIPGRVPPLPEQLHAAHQLFVARRRELIRLLDEGLGEDAAGELTTAIRMLDEYDLFLSARKAGRGPGANLAEFIAERRRALQVKLRELETKRYGRPARTLVEAIAEARLGRRGGGDQELQPLLAGAHRPDPLADLADAAEALFDRQVDCMGGGTRDEVVNALFRPGTHRAEILAADYLDALRAGLAGGGYAFANANQLVGREPIGARPAEHAYDAARVEVTDIDAVFAEFRQAKELITRLFARRELASARGFLTDQFSHLTQLLNKFATAEQRIRAILQEGRVNLANQREVREAIQAVFNTLDMAAMRTALTEFRRAIDGLRTGAESRRQIMAGLGDDAAERFAVLFGSEPVDPADGLPQRGVVPTLLRELSGRAERLMTVQDRSVPKPVDGDAVRQQKVDRMAGWLHRNVPGFVRLATAMSAEPIPELRAPGSRLLPRGVTTIAGGYAGGLHGMRAWLPRIISPEAYSRQFDGPFAYAEDSMEFDRLNQIDMLLAGCVERRDYAVPVPATGRLVLFLNAIDFPDGPRRTLIDRAAAAYHQVDKVLSAIYTRSTAVVDVDRLLAELDSFDLAALDREYEAQLGLFTRQEAAIKARFPGTPAEKEARYQDCIAVLKALQARQRSLILTAIAEQKLFLRGPEGSTPAEMNARKRVATAALIRESEYMQGFTAALQVPGPAGGAAIYEFEDVEQMLGDAGHPMAHRPADLPPPPGDGAGLTQVDVQASYQNYQHATQLIRGFFSRPEFAGVREQWLGDHGHLARLTQALNQLATAEAALQRLQELIPPLDAADLASVDIVNAKVRAALANVAAASVRIEAAQNAFRDQLNELRQQVLAKRGPVWQAIRRAARTETEALNRARAILGDDHLSFAATRGILPTIHRELRARADHFRDVQIAYATPGIDPVDYARRVVELRDQVYASQPGFYRLAEARGGEVVAYPRRRPDEDALVPRMTAAPPGGLAHITDWQPVVPEDMFAELPRLHDAPDGDLVPAAIVIADEELAPEWRIGQGDVRRGVAALLEFPVARPGHGVDADHALTRNSYIMRYYLVNLNQRLLRYRERVNRFLTTIGLPPAQRDAVLASIDRLRTQVDVLLSPERCRALNGNLAEALRLLDPAALQVALDEQFAAQQAQLSEAHIAAIPAIAGIADPDVRAARIADYQAVLQGLQAEHKALLQQTNRFQRVLVGDASVTAVDCPLATQLIAADVDAPRMTQRMLASFDPWLDEVEGDLNASGLAAYAVDRVALLGQRPIDAPPVLAEGSAADLSGLQPLLAQYESAERFLGVLLARPELRPLADFLRPQLSEIRRHLVKVADKDSRAESLFWRIDEHGNRVRRTVGIDGVDVEVSITNPESMRLAAEAVQRELTAELMQAFTHLAMMLQGLEWIRLGDASAASLRARVVDDDGGELVAAQAAPTVAEFAPFQAIRAALLARFRDQGLTQEQAAERLRILLGNRPLIVGSDESENGFHLLPNSPDVAPPAHTAAVGILPNICARMMAVIPPLAIAQRRLVDREPAITRLERRNNLLARVYTEQPGFYRLANAASVDEFVLPLVNLPERRTVAHAGGLAHMAAWRPDARNITGALEEFVVDGALPALAAVDAMPADDAANPSFARLDNFAARLTYFQARMERFLRAIGAEGAVADVRASFERIREAINVVLDVAARDRTGVDFAAALARLNAVDLDHLLRGEFAAEQMRAFLDHAPAIKARLGGTPAEQEARFQDCLAIMRALQREHATSIRQAHEEQRHFLADPALHLADEPARRAAALQLMMPHDPLMRDLRVAADSAPGYTVANHQQLVGEDDFADEPDEVDIADDENVTLAELEGVYQGYRQARDLLRTILDRPELAPLSALVEPRLRELERLLIRIADAQSRIRTILAPSVEGEYQRVLADGTVVDLNNPASVQAAVRETLIAVHADFHAIESSLIQVAQRFEWVRRRGVIPAGDDTLLPGEAPPDPADYERAYDDIRANLAEGASPEVAEVRFNALFGRGRLLGEDDDGDLSIALDLEDHPGVFPSLLEEFQHRAYRLRDRQDDVANPGMGEWDDRAEELVNQLQLEAPGFYRLADQVGANVLPIPGTGDPGAVTTPHPGGIAGMAVWQPRLTTPLIDAVDELAEMPLAEGGHLARITAADPIDNFARDALSFDRLDGFNRRLTHYQGRVQRFLASVGVTDFSRFNDAFNRVRNRINVLLDQAARGRAGVSVEALLARLGDNFDDLFAAELQPLFAEQLAVLEANREVINARFDALAPAGLDWDQAELWRRARFADCQSIMHSLQREQRQLLQAVHTEQRRFLGADEFDYEDAAAPEARLAAGAVLPVGRREAMQARRELVQRALVAQDRQFRSLARVLGGTLLNVVGPDGHGGELDHDHANNRFGFHRHGLSGQQVADRLLGYEAIERPPVEPVPGLDGIGGDPNTVNLQHLQRVFQEYQRAKTLFERFRDQPEFAVFEPRISELLANLETTINRIATAQARVNHLLGRPPNYERLADDAVLRAAIAAELAEINDLLQPVGDMATAIDTLARGLAALRRPGTAAAPNPERDAVMAQLRDRYGDADAEARFNLLFGRFGASLTDPASRGVLPTVLRELRTSAQRLIDVQAQIAGVALRPGGDHEDPVALQARLDAMLPRLRAHLVTEAPGFYRLVDRTANADAAVAFGDQEALRGRHPHPAAGAARFRGAGNVAWHEHAFGMHRMVGGVAQPHDPHFMRHVGVAAGNPYSGAGRVAGGFELGHGMLDCAPSVDSRAVHLLDDVARYVTGGGVDLVSDPFTYLNAFRSEWQAVYDKQVQFFRNIGLDEDKIKRLMQPLDNLFERIDIVLSAEQRQANVHRTLAQLQAEFGELTEDRVRGYVNTALQAQQAAFDAMQADVERGCEARHGVVPIEFADLQSALRGLQAEQRVVVMGAEPRPANEAAGVPPRPLVPGLMIAQDWFLHGHCPQHGAAPLAGDAAAEEARRNHDALIVAYNPNFAVLSGYFADAFGRDSFANFNALQAEANRLFPPGGAAAAPPPALDQATEAVSGYADLIAQHEQLQARLATMNKLLSLLSSTPGPAREALAAIRRKMQTITELLDPANKWKYVTEGAERFKQDLVAAYAGLDGIEEDLRTAVDLPGVQATRQASDNKITKSHLKITLTVAARRFHETAREFAQTGIQVANQPAARFANLVSATSQTTSASYTRVSLRSAHSKAGDDNAAREVIGMRYRLLGVGRVAARRRARQQLAPERVAAMRGNWTKRVDVETRRILTMATS